LREVGTDFGPLSVRVAFDCDDLFSPAQAMA
jgi:hypothetical protein